MNKKRLNTLILATNAFLALSCALGILLLSLKSDIEPLYKIEGMFAFASLIFTFIYLVNGFTKQSSNFYKAAMWINAANALMVTAVSVNEGIKYIPIVSCAICFACIFVLAIGKNLGKNKSLVLCIIVVVLRTLGLFTSFDINGELNIIILLLISQLVLAIMILVSTIAKYNDKDIRGSKIKFNLH